MSIIQEALKKAQGQSKDTPSRETPAQKEKPLASKSIFDKTVVAKTRKAYLKDNFKPIAIFLSLLIAAVIFLIGTSISKSNNAGKALAAKTAVSTQEVQYKPMPKIETKPKETTVSEIQTVLKVANAQYPDLVLNGIMYLEIGPRAIINDAIVEEGDTVKGARVTKINKKSVVLEYNNVEITLNLK